MNRPAWIVLTVCGTAIWFGFKLGPRSTESLKTEPAATLAAQNFVTRAVGENVGGEIAITRTSVTEKHDLWHVVGSGTATMDGRQGNQRFDFDLTEAWEAPSHSWRLKALSVTRPKQVGTTP